MCNTVKDALQHILVELLFPFSLKQSGCSPLTFDINKEVFQEDYRSLPLLRAVNSWLTPSASPLRRQLKCTLNHRNYATI